jgi:lipid-A-disaccharide synthase
MPTIYLIAGETSGDVLGGRLMRAIRSQLPNARFIGIGGAEMQAEGLTSLFPMSELSLMGIAEILPHIPKLLRRIRETTAHIRQTEPDIVITIDAPDFCFRVLRKLGRTDFPLVHYVAPTVWAWKPGRARKIARFLDHILTLLPFEPPYFEREGLPATYVGHSAVEDDPMHADGKGWRREQGIGDTERLLCLLPGSRMGEVSRLGPVFSETVRQLHSEGYIDRVAIPVAPSVRQAVEELTGQWDVPTVLSHTPAARYRLFAASDAALAASGTVSLELALTATPMVIAYRVSALTAWIVRRMLLTDTAVLPNLVVGEKFVPEFIQEKCTVENIVPAIGSLLVSPEARQSQAEGFGRFSDLMRLDGRAPSERAAEVVLDLIARGRDSRHEPATRNER